MMLEKPYPPELVEFQRESNRIEGIVGVSCRQIEALMALLAEKKITEGVLTAYVHVVQPGARLRSTPDVPGVRIGHHIAPPSGPQLLRDLDKLLHTATRRLATPYSVHCAFEMLHPFTDGNGRSGRALWLWMRGGVAPLGFLHQFYYEALEAQPSNGKR